MTAIVHLVWGPLGSTPLRQFLDSYGQHDAGAPHDLFVVFNGVASEQRPALLGELASVRHSLIELDRPTQDLDAYAQAAARLEHERLCFLNSYSVILADGWLRAFESALDMQNVGLVGATGSWASFGSLALDSLGLPNAYRRIGLARNCIRRQLGAIALERSTGSSPSEELGQATARATAASALATARSLPASLEQVVRFAGFPNPHLRTNAFMVERALFTRLTIGGLGSKSKAYLVESGRESLTRQAERLGLRALVVDRDGGTYAKDAWPKSQTFWHRDQEGLLIEDNQTRMYATGPAERRAFLSTLAWGEQANPRLP